MNFSERNCSMWVVRKQHTRIQREFV